MNSDLRIDFIINHVGEAAKEANPEAPSPPIDEESRAVIGFCLNIFDRLLPMLVSAVVVEYRKQTQNDA